MVQRILLGIIASVALAPVAGMVLVFAVLPALPIALLIGAMLGPSTLLGYAQQEEDERDPRSLLDGMATALGSLL